MNRNMEMRPVLQHGRSALWSGGIIAHSLCPAQARRVVGRLNDRCDVVCPDLPKVL
jgi:hypothetical protein